MPSFPTRQLRHTTSAVRIYVAMSAIAVTVVLSGCQTQSPTFSEAEKANVEAEIRATRDAYFEAATSFDAEAMVAFWDPDFIHVSNAYEAPLTLEMLVEAWRPLDRIDMDISFDRVVALSPDAGYTLFFASYVVYDTAGVAVDSSDWAGTHIWIRSGGEWKVQAVHEGRPGRG